MSDKKRVMIVEDDAQLCAQLGRIIEFFGYEPLLAGTAQEARANFKASAPDVVITDLHLPGATGLDLLHEFHEVNPDLPVIVLTGFPSEETIRETLLEGGYTYVAKPVDLEHLRTLIQHALGEK
ncbi:MAG: response regulator [Calditrichota bacterium]